MSALPQDDLCMEATECLAAMSDLGRYQAIKVAQDFHGKSSPFRYSRCHDQLPIPVRKARSFYCQECRVSPHHNSLRGHGSCTGAQHGRRRGCGISSGIAGEEQWNPKSQRQRDIRLTPSAACHRSPEQSKRHRPRVRRCRSILMALERASEVPQMMSAD